MRKQNMYIYLVIGWKMGGILGSNLGCLNSQSAWLYRYMYISKLTKIENV